jgi:hypothetical protein
MALYFFRIDHDRYSAVVDNGFKLTDREAVWEEITKVCAELAPDACRSLQRDSEWRMELLDESKKPLMRIRLVAQSLD